MTLCYAFAGGAAEPAATSRRSAAPRSRARARRRGAPPLVGMNSYEFGICIHNNKYVCIYIYIYITICVYSERDWYEFV